jgi:hypothetical protein
MRRVFEADVLRCPRCHASPMRILAGRLSGPPRDVVGVDVHGPVGSQCAAERRHMPIHWVRIFVVIGMGALSLGCTAVESQPMSKPTAEEMARLSIDGGSLSRALDLGAAAALDSSVEALELKLGRGLSEGEAQQVREILRSALAEIVTPDSWEQALAETYRAHFTEDEIEQALEFYRSPVGRKVLEEDALMAQEIEDRVVASFEAQRDEFSAKVDAVLAEIFPATREPETR